MTFQQKPAQAAGRFVWVQRARGVARLELRAVRSDASPVLLPPSHPSRPSYLSLPYPNPQGVDIFSKDYLFIPIHDALHWSLVVVCFPGEIGRAFEDQQRREQVKALGSSGGSGSSKGAAIPKSGSGGAAAAAGGGVGSGGMLGSGWEVQVAGSGEQQVQAGGQQGGARLLPVERRACLLHLDSMPGEKRGGGVKDLRLAV